LPDDSELIKAGTEGLVEGTLKSVHELILRLFGPAADEAGELFKDYVHHYRERKKRFFETTLSKISKADIQPHPVPLKLLKPIIENATIEDNDELQDVWANMLSNAANSGDEGNVAPVFPVILKELDIREVRFLNKLYETALETKLKYVVKRPEVARVRYDRFNVYELQGIYGQALDEELRFPNSRTLSREELQLFRFSLDVVLRNNLVDEIYDVIEDRDNHRQTVGSVFVLSTLGARFVCACRPPMKDADLDGGDNVIQ
jgi:hypothetical protein